MKRKLLGVVDSNQLYKALRNSMPSKAESEKTTIQFWDTSDTSDYSWVCFGSRNVKTLIWPIGIKWLANQYYMKMLERIHEELHTPADQINSPSADEILRNTEAHHATYRNLQQP